MPFEYNDNISIGIPLMALPEGPIEAPKEARPILSITGLFACLFYFLFFSYLYGSSIYKGKLSTSLKSAHGFTLSESFEFSEKIVSTMLLVTLSGLLVGLLIEKGFVSDKNPLKITIVAITFGCLMFLLLLFFVPPSLKSYSQERSHIIITSILLFFMISSSCGYSILYRDLFKNVDGELATMYVFTLLMMIFAFVILLLFTFTSIFYFKNHRKIMEISTAIAIFEIFILILYGVVIGILSTLPPLLDCDVVYKVCQECV
jgi:hypothetical protein